MGELYALPSGRRYALALLYRWLGGILERRGNLSLAQVCYNGAGRSNPADVRAHFSLGRLLLIQGRLEEAAEAFRRVLHAKPDHPEANNDLGVALEQQGMIEEAAQCYRAALRSRPDYAAARNNLGNIHLSYGRLAEAEASYREALRRDAHYVEAHNNLGLVLIEQGRHEEAEQCCRRALVLRPNFAGALNNLGSALQHQGRIEEAVGCFQEALRLQPALGEAHINLALILGDTNQLAGAVAYYERKLKLNPDSVEAHLRLGVGLQAQGRLREAKEHFEAVLKIRPDSAEAHSNIATGALREGDLDEALSHFGKALAHAPAFAGAHSGYFFSLNYSADHDPGEVFSEHARWARQHADHLLGEVARHRNSRRKKKRLRVGYVSPDFCQHSVSYFIEPVIRHHDRDAVEVFCYSNALKPDHVTERIRADADTWRDIHLKTYQQVCEIVREDGIDILVDLAGHTGRNRLMVFAHKPAPIQVTYLGYPNTTGLAAMDYRITDAQADPPGLTERYYTEELVRLPRPFLAYVPPMDSPGIAAPPALEKGHITFGSFNNAAKVNSRVIALWAKILHAVPGSRIVLKHFAFSSPDGRKRFLECFAAQGIDSARVDLLDFVPAVSSHLELYRRIDIALDPFPYNGTTTTCEALWMGVPVIALAGKVHAARVGVSLLSSVGLQDLIAGDEAAYSRIAVRLAQDLERLQRLRGSLRESIRVAPLADGKGLTGALESEYRKMWQRWCDRARSGEKGGTRPQRGAEKAAGGGKNTDGSPDVGRLLDTAGDARRQGNLAWADILCRTALDAQPRNAEAWESLGITACRIGKYRHADDYLRQAIACGGQARTLENELARRPGGGVAIPEAGAPRYLLIKAWGCGFWSDVTHVIGSLLLAEMTGRLPVVHWGDNSLFADGTGRNAFEFYFEPVSSATLTDLTQPGLRFFPSKWNALNLSQDNVAKWRGEHSRMGAVYFFDRAEEVAVGDYFVSVRDLVPWLDPDSPLHGQPVSEVYRYLVSKYLRPKRAVADRIDRFHCRHLADAPYVGVHVRGSDKALEQPELGEINNSYYEVVDRLLSERDYRVFLLTDSRPMADDFRRRYGKRLVLADCRRSSDRTGIHYRTRGPDRHELGIEVLQDTYLAARADRFIGNGHSNVSCMVEYLKRWHDDEIVLLAPSRTNQWRSPELFDPNFEAR